MSSPRMLFASGAVMAGVGAAMLCAAGLASADAGGASGAVTPSAHPVAVARAGQSAAQPNSRRHPAAAAVKAASAAPAPAVANAVTPTPVGASRSTRRLAAPTPAPAPAPAPLVSSTGPVDPAQFAGTYYEQGSVKQFFSIGLVNTKAVYTLNPDGTIRVQNSGNYFFNGGPQSSIVGSAVPVNATNTALNVSFLPFNSATPPGNYTILAHAPDYNWVIVSDPSGYSGYILTRNQTIAPQDYQSLLVQARALGVKGPITPTVQYGS